MTSTARADPLTIGIAGASGGLGASTFAVAIAVRAAVISPGRAACIDGDLWSGGLDVTACIEHEPGLRWPDLSGVLGDTDGPALVRQLPSAGGAVVLASRPGPPGPTGPQAVSAAVQRSVVAGLSHAVDTTVIDLGRAAHAEPVMLAACDAVLLLSGAEARHLADAEAACLALESVDALWLVTRAAGDCAEPIAAHLGVPVAADLPDDARVAADARRGRTPGDRERGRLSVAAELVLRRVPVLPKQVAS